MRWCLSTLGSAEYILPVILSTSVTPVSPYTRHRSFKMYLIERVWDALGDGDRMNSEMHSEIVIELVWRCNWRPCSCELAARNQASLETHLEAGIEWVWRCTWRPGLCDLAGRNRAGLEIHLEAMIERVWRCTGRPWSSELAGCNRASLEIHLEAVIERVWRCTCRLWSSEIGGVLGGGRFGGRRNGSWDSIHWLTCNCENVESWVQHPPRDEKLAGIGRLSILGWCCTWCML